MEALLNQDEEDDQEREERLAELQRLMDEDKLADAEREQFIVELRSSHAAATAEHDITRAELEAEIAELRARLLEQPPPQEEPVYIDPIVAEAMRRCDSGPLLTRPANLTHRLAHLVTDISVVSGREEEHRAAILADELLAERTYRDSASAREHGSGPDWGLVVPVGTSWGGAQQRRSPGPRVQEGMPPRAGGGRYSDIDGYEVVRVRAVTAQGIRSRQLSGGLSSGRSPTARAHPLPDSPDRGASASLRAGRLRAQTSAD